MPEKEEVRGNELPYLELSPVGTMGPRKTSKEVHENLF
jgi:hypothetical protein